MGVVGADLYDNAIMTYVPEDGIMKHNAVKKSSKCYLMMESHKFDFKANYVYATFDDVDGVICEDGLSKEIQDKLSDENHIKNYGSEELFFILCSFLG